MKYRAKIYVLISNWTLAVATKPCESRKEADELLIWISVALEQATGGHIEKYVDGIGWVVFDEDETK